MDRRSFLQSGTGILAGAGLAPALLAEKPQTRFQTALSQYSLRALLGDGSLDALDFPKFTKEEIGIGAIDLWEGGLPGDKLDDAAYLANMRGKAAAAGTELYLLMAGALDAEPKKREESVAKIGKSVSRAASLGCNYLRVFLRAPGKEEEAGLTASVDALRPLADIAGEHTVMVVIEPGASELSSKGVFLAKVMEKLAHPHCRLMPDFGKLKNNVYEGTKAMLPYTETVSAKMHSFDGQGKQPDFDYPRLAEMIVASDFKGYIAIEWEGSKLKPVEGVKASQKLLNESFGGAIS